MRARDFLTVCCDFSITFGAARNVTETSSPNRSVSRGFEADNYNAIIIAGRGGVLRLRTGRGGRVPDSCKYVEKWCHTM